MSRLIEEEEKQIQPGLIGGLLVFIVLGLTCAVCLMPEDKPPEVNMDKVRAEIRAKRQALDSGDANWRGAAVKNAVNYKARDQCVRSLSYGNNWVFEEQIKANLLAPDSYDFEAAKVRENAAGQLIVVWEFLASNVYGVKVRHSATGIVWDVSKCAKHEPGSTELLSVDQM